MKSLAALAYPKPAFAVLGNHDNWDSRDAWSRAFENSAIELVENRVARIKVIDETVCLRGLGDVYSIIGNMSRFLVTVETSSLLRMTPPV